MAESNIDRFNTYTALIFGELYKKFPQRAGITPEGLLNLDPSKHDVTETPEEINFLDDTLRWLHEAGYIWCENIHYGTSAVLTPKGLEALRSVPSSVDPKKPIGEQLVEAIKNRTLDAAAGLVPQILVAGYRLLAQGAGGGGA